ncbi:bifunctional protein FolD [Spirochaetia bacterium]|nr:bifunctional protein FolD [Spirochaetia bacterium]
MRDKRATIIDGKKSAAAVREDARNRTLLLAGRGIVPCLAVILVGTDPASISYVTGKEKALAAAGMLSRDIRLPADTPESTLLDLIAELNADPCVHGILVQLPVPQQIRADLIIESIDPSKDVDGLHPVSMGNLLRGQPTFIPCTPAGIMLLLQESGIETAGTHTVIIGRSHIVGRPLANLLSLPRANATVTLCHTGTNDLSHFTHDADILIVAVAKPAFVTADMVKTGAVVVDVGVNRVPAPESPKGYRLCGDVDFEPVSEKASFITPVPGGVGPLTIAMLLRNVIQAAERI